VGDAGRVRQRPGRRRAAARLPARTGDRRDGPAGVAPRRLGRSRTRSFRRSFLLGFGERIGERLRAVAAGEATEDERRRALPVLASRAERIDAAVAEAFPGMVSKTFEVGHVGGFAGGQVAAELASLDASSGHLVEGRDKR
jgi:hypothetical protein